MPAYTMITPSKQTAAQDVINVLPHLKAACVRLAKVHKKSDLVLEWYSLPALARQIFKNDLQKFLSLHKIVPNS